MEPPELTDPARVERRAIDTIRDAMDRTGADGVLAEPGDSVTSIADATLAI